MLYIAKHIYGASLYLLWNINLSQMLCIRLSIRGKIACGHMNTIFLISDFDRCHRFTMMMTAFVEMKINHNLSCVPSDGVMKHLENFISIRIWIAAKFSLWPSVFFIKSNSIADQMSRKKNQMRIFYANKIKIYVNRCDRRVIIRAYHDSAK